MSRELWETLAFAELPRHARLLFLGLDAMADDLGNVVNEPSKIRAFAYPHDDDVTDAHVSKWVQVLIAAGFLTLYRPDAKRTCLHVPLHACPRVPKRIACPPMEGQSVPAKVTERAPVEVPQVLRPMLDQFLGFLVERSANKRMSEGRKKTVEAAIVSVSKDFGVEACIMGMREAIAHEATSERYVRAVAKNNASPELRLVEGGAPAKKVSEMSMTELRQSHGTRRR